MATKGKLVTKEVMMEVLLEFHHKVQEPVMDEVLERLGKVETRMEGMESEMGGLKKAVWNVSDRQGKRLDSHEERISALEEGEGVVVS